MTGVLVEIFWLLGAMVLGAGLLLFAWRRIVKRWTHNMDVSDDAGYAETLTPSHRLPYAEISIHTPTSIGMHPNSPS